NPGPSAPKADALPDCATPRQALNLAGQSRDQGGHCPTPVRDGSLGLERGLPEAQPQVVAPEQRIVAKTALPERSLQDPARGDTLHHYRDGWPQAYQRTAVSGRALM